MKKSGKSPTEKPTNGRQQRKLWPISTSTITVKFSSRSSNEDLTSSDACLKTTKSEPCSKSTIWITLVQLSTRSFQKQSWTSTSADCHPNPTSSLKLWAKTTSPSPNDLLTLTLFSIFRFFEVYKILALLKFNKQYQTDSQAQCLCFFSSFLLFSSSSLLKSSSSSSLP